MLYEEEEEEERGDTCSGVCVHTDVITRDGFGFGLVSCPLCHTYMYIHRLNDLASLSFLPPFLSSVTCL